jgi:thiol:disulfide interchange protein DsbD
MRIKGLFALIALLNITTSIAQIYDPVKWQYSANSISDTEFEVVAGCTIEAGWHVYALNASDNPDAIGPISTSLKFPEGKGYKAKGKTQQGKYITHFDPNFEMDLNYFEKSARFSQKFTRSSKDALSITGELEFMVCNDERCLFPEPMEFTVALPALSGGAAEPAEAPTGDPSGEAAAPSGILEPVKWSLAVTDKGNGQYELAYTAVSEKGWHVYSQTLESDQGPVPTTFRFELPAGVSRIGEVKEPRSIKKYDPNFMMNVNYFDGKATFTQTLSAQTPPQEPFQVSAEFMCCNDETCLPPKELFWKVNLTALTATTFDPDAELSATALEKDPFRIDKANPENPISWCGTEKEQLGLWMIFLFGIIGGLLALLTPCVFPMIPLTVSFFTKGSEGGSGKRRAVLYGVFILLIYFILSLPFHLSKNVDPEVLNNIATNVWLNLAFFVIFIFFAISFFGYFEITLPSGLANKVDQGSNLGGAIGIFFMALTLAIVSFSCTGPILGTVIGSIYTTDALGVVNFLGMELSLPAAKVSAAMLGFGLSLGLPFGLFAAFPSMLKKLPKSGGWLEDFKVSLGFAEVALALKFLSQADLVEQWGFLKREVFFAIWILIFVLWILYLVGRFRFKPGQGSKKMSKFKLAFTIALTLFTLRILPGVLPKSEWNRFAFLSGFPPPRDYSLYPHEEEFRIYRDLAEAMEVAKRENKPVFVDFTGWACVNCRKMEENVWPDDRVKSLLENEYIMVSLYVDEKVELPAEAQFVYTTADGRNKKIKTVGSKWSTLQTETFRNNSQPFYALLSPDSTLLTPTRQYDTDIDAYAEWLQCGVSTFRQGPVSQEK